MSRKLILFLIPCVLLLIPSCYLIELERQLQLEMMKIKTVDELLFLDNDTITFKVRAQGVPSCDFVVDKATDWINVISITHTGRDNVVEITVASEIDHSHFGTINGSIKLLTCLGQHTISAQCTVGSDIAYDFPDSLIYRSCENTLPLELSNLGIIEIEYNFLLPGEIVCLDELSGILQAGQSIQIDLTVDRTDIQEPLVNTSIQIEIEGEIYSIPTDINSFPDPRVFLSQQIIDAEYDRVGDLLVMIESSGPDLIIYDVYSDSLINLNLGKRPTCISISPDGKKVAVGHEYFITIVDLEDPGIVKEFPTSIIANDIVISNLDWVYVTPKWGQWTTMRCFNLDEADPLEYDHTNYNPIYSGSNIKLHPSGTVIYSFHGGFIDKFDIRSGIASHMYNQKDESAGMIAWFSQEGSRFYCSNTNVLQSSFSEAGDMILLGEIPVDRGHLSNLPIVKWIEHSSSKKELYIISLIVSEDYNNPLIYVHDSETFEFLRSYKALGYLDCSEGGSGNIRIANPKYVFCTRDESKLLLISHAIDFDSSVPWSIEILNIL